MTDLEKLEQYINEQLKKLHNNPRLYHYETIAKIGAYKDILSVISTMKMDNGESKNEC